MFLMGSDKGSQQNMLHYARLPNRRLNGNQIVELQIWKQVLQRFVVQITTCRLCFKLLKGFAEPHNRSSHVSMQWQRIIHVLIYLHIAIPTEINYTVGK